jgi:hypothetical protein
VGQDRRTDQLGDWFATFSNNAPSADKMQSSVFQRQLRLEPRRTMAIRLVDADRSISIRFLHVPLEGSVPMIVCFLRLVDDFQAAFQRATRANGMQCRLKRSLEG